MKTLETLETPRLNKARRVGGEVAHVPEPHGVRELAIAFGLSFAFMSPILGVTLWSTHQIWCEEEVEAENALAYERLVAAPAAGQLPVGDAAHGRDLFTNICSACHSPEGKGINGLGKNLVHSDFVALQDDDTLREFIATGRPDAKPMPMPPKAGHDELTDDDLRHLVMFLRGLQDARRMPTLPAFVAPVVVASSAQKSAALVAAGGDVELAGFIAHGDSVFHSICIACHGKGGVGIKGNGKALVGNDFIKSISDDALLAFVKQGRGPSDAKNTTGIQMPPKGGSPALSDDDLLDVIAYLRTLQGDTKRASASF